MTYTCGVCGSVLRYDARNNKYYCPTCLNEKPSGTAYYKRFVMKDVKPDHSRMLARIRGEDQV